LTIDEALTNGKIILVDDGATTKNKYNFGLTKPLHNEKTPKKRHSARTYQRWLFAVDDMGSRLSLEDEIP
jgi:hypothetical protein